MSKLAKPPVVYGVEVATAREAAFVHEYLCDKNATSAAIRAGFARRSAKQRGNELLNRPDVAAAVAAGMKELADRCKVTQEDVVRGLLSEAKFTGEGSSHAARVAAWDKLAKHLGMYVERHEVTGGLRIVIDEDDDPDG